tara:strand:- start:9799 stop:14193 length:4395 start_codon:yes stop_codon:yes gene_type:complete
MKYMKSIFFLLLGVILMPGQVMGQEIYEPEGVNMPGQWNGWTNSNDPAVMGNFRMDKRSFGQGQYISTLHIASSGGDATAGTYQWLFTSGPDDNLYANKWANANPINIDGISSMVYQGGTDNSITVEDGFHYTFILDDNILNYDGYNDLEAAVFKTSASPVSITSVSGVPASVVTENQPVTINVELDKAKSPEEKIYLRYSTDSFATTAAIEITDFAGGTSGTAQIPGQPKNAAVEFYVLSTTIDASSWNGKADLATISFENNGGENYTYFYEADITPLNSADNVSRTPQISWYEVDNLVGHDFQLDNDSDFSSPVIDVADSAGTSENSYTVSSPLDVYTRYYWRFRGDTASTWSNTFNFRTESGVTFGNVQFPASHVMNEGENLTVYGQLFVPGVTINENESADISAWLGVNDTEEDPANWVEASWSSASFNTTSTTAGNNDEYELGIGSGLSPGTYYYAYRYQYKTQDYAYGVIDGFWADTNQTLGKLVILDVPELSAPADNASDVALQPQLSWSTTDANISEYNLQISESSAFGTTVVDEQDLPSASTTYDVASGALNHETTYYWRVRSEYDTTASGWSAPASFTTIQDVPAKVALTSPADAAEGTSRTPDFEWEENQNADTYEFVVSTDQSFADGKQQVVNENNLAVNTYSVDQANILEKETTYYWRVRGVNSTGNGAWSDVYSFTTIGDPPSAVALNSPQNLATGVSTLPTFEWQADAAATAYQLQVSEVADDFDTPAVLALDKSDITQTTYTVLQVDKLDEAATYYWRVRSSNNAGNSAWSDTLEFSTAAPVPQLASPEDEVTSTPVNPFLSWIEIQSAQHYDLQIATDDAFTQLVTDTAAITDTSFVPGGLNYGNNYFWRVRSEVNDFKSDWSAAFSFTVKASPPAFPQLVSPDSGAVNVGLNPDLVWEAPANASTYDVQVALNGSFTNELIVDTTGFEPTTISLSELENGTDYFWRVRAINTEGTTGQWSEVSAFATLPLGPALVSLVSPADSVVDVSLPVQFDWQAADRATRYELQYSEDASFTFTSDTTLSGTELSLSDLSSGTGYFWRVRAENSGGISAWSEVRFVDIGINGAAGPELLSPADAFSGIESETNLEWASTAGSDHYEVQVSASDEFDSFHMDTSNVEANELSISSLEINSTYYWRVRGHDTNGSTDWSVSYSFSTQTETPGAVLTHQPADSVTNAERTISFSWYPVENADIYQFKLSEQKDFSISIDSSNISDTTLTISGLPYDTDHYWKVRAVNEAGEGEWSAVSYFKTTIPLPGAPELVSPENEDESRLPLRFGWNETNFTESYDLQVSTADDFESPVIDTSGVESLTLETNILEEATTYYWRVRGVNRIGNGTWSEVMSFTTEALTSIEDEFVPDEFALHQNYPNPFNPTTNIQYDVKQAGEVRIRIYDITGRHIQTLVNERKNAGRYRVTFDAGSLASGIYLMRMESGSFLQIKKMTLIK